LRLQQQQDEIEQLRGDLRDAMNAYRALNGKRGNDDKKAVF